MDMMQRSGVWAEVLDEDERVKQFYGQSAVWRKDQEENRTAVARHENANQQYFELGATILEVAANAYDNYRVRSLPEKRRLAGAILSNLVVDGENVVPTYKEPFGLLGEGFSRPNWLPY